MKGSDAGPWFTQRLFQLELILAPTKQRDERGQTSTRANTHLRPPRCGSLTESQQLNKRSGHKRLFIKLLSEQELTRWKPDEERDGLSYGKTMNNNKRYS